MKMPCKWGGTLLGSDPRLCSDQVGCVSISVKGSASRVSHSIRCSDRAEIFLRIDWNGHVRFGSLHPVSYGKSNRAAKGCGPGNGSIQKCLRA